MADDFADLATLTITDHGDARERAVWPEVVGHLSNYEVFWREMIVLLTNRIVPQELAGLHWVRLRQSIPIGYEKLAMYNYSLFYYASNAWRAIEDDRRQLASGAYPHPERVFASLQTCIEQVKRLQSTAREILRRIGILDPKLPKHPQSLYGTIGAYRNAFAHDPLLGRAVDHSRELLPPKNRLPKKDFLLWRDTAVIPTSEMVDCLELENRLWLELAHFLQAQWKSLAELFIEARKRDDFIKELGLDALLPIQCEPLSIASPSAASGTIVARSDVP